MLLELDKAAFHGVVGSRRSGFAGFGRQIIYGNITEKKRICEAASYWWNKKYSSLGDCNLSIEDWFYTAYLPSKEKSYRNSMLFPDISTALSFSYEAIAPYRRNTKPFGFHNMASKWILDSME